jgi:hypothetical protein
VRLVCACSGYLAARRRTEALRAVLQGVRDSDCSAI